jgi:hypothetical protein
MKILFDGIQEDSMKKFSLALAIMIICTLNIPAQEPPSALYPFSMSFDEKLTLLRVFNAPSGYERYPEVRMNEFQAWVTNLPLQAKHKWVVLWNGQMYSPPDSVAAVIDFGIGTEDQQNPDIPMQMILEYLRAVGAIGDFPVLVSRKDTLTYNRWLGGNYSFTARKVLVYKPAEGRPSTVNEYYRYLHFVLSFINSKTLLLNLKPVGEEDIAPANLFIQFRKDDPDSVGHCAVILDVCSNGKGEKLVMVGWGGVPAHSFLVARPRAESGNPWFTIPELKEYLKRDGEGKFYRFSN